jgi:2,4-dienoyl-CoA reductase-like NADH-dependent reductase (Old Yellow Enzyme family)
MHSGRKGSCVSLFLSFSGIASALEGGWPDRVVGPSDVPIDPSYPLPRELTVNEIQEIVIAFKDSARRAVTAGYDIINIHAAHGYLLSSFLSPHANRRTDKYGGSFENRIRILIEVIDAIRAVIPESMPLIVRYAVHIFSIFIHSLPVSRLQTASRTSMLGRAGPSPTPSSSHESSANTVLISLISPPAGSRSRRRLTSLTPRLGLRSR